MWRMAGYFPDQGGLISHPTVGRRLSWPRWLVIYPDVVHVTGLSNNRVGRDVIRLLCAAPLDVMRKAMNVELFDEQFLARINCV